MEVAARPIERARRLHAITVEGWAAALFPTVLDRAGLPSFLAKKLLVGEDRVKED